MTTIPAAGRKPVLRHRRLAGAGLALGLLLGTGGAASAATDPQKFQSYLYSDAYKAALAKAWSNIPKAVLPECATLSQAKPAVKLLEDVTFDSSGVPKSGVWTGIYPVSGCGVARTLNFLFIAGPDGVRSVVTLPGTTLADPLLQRDALFFAFTGAGLKAPGCKDRIVVDTAVDRSNGANGAPGKAPWHETWTVAACGKMLIVPMEFVPDANGTTINQRPADVRELTK